MKKIASSAMILGLLLLGSMLLSPAHAVLPVAPYSTLIDATTQGNSPVTVDPAAAYDTASGQLIQQVYDTLISFDGEHTDSYIPNLATSWTIENVTVTPGISPPFNVAYYNRPWYYRYTFALTPNALWQNPTYGRVTTADVAYSFKREMIEDYANGPAWMLDEPLLGNAIGPTAWNIGNAANLGPDAATVGQMIDNSVQYNSTHVWLNIAYPGPYPPMLGILCQTWSSILCQNWIKNWVISVLKQPDWDGTFGAGYTDWLKAHFATTPPTSLDFPTSAGAQMMGSGPYYLTKLDYTANYWTVDRWPGYFRGWPAPFPMLSGVKPAGYVEEFTVTWNFDWATRFAMFLSGDVDFIDVPRQYIPQMYQSSTPPYYPPNYPLDGIRCIGPLPELAVYGLFFQFNINPTTPYGSYVASGTFSETAIPYDFFGNPTWGIHVRKAFAESIDYNTFITTAFLGEALTPATAIIPGLTYYDPTVAGYSYNLMAAAQEFQAVQGLWNTGFTITLAYNTGSNGQTLCNLLKTAIEGLNPKFHVSLVAVSSGAYVTAMRGGQLSAFYTGWLVDYPDPNDFAEFFYTPSAGYFAAWQGYANSAMDALVAQGMATPAGSDRQTVYSKIQKLAVADCSFVPLVQPIRRHFERDWVCGWYYNPIYPGIYAYNLWKWYYIPQAFYSTVVQPYSNQLPCDNTYTGSITMKEIAIVARAFGASYGPPISVRWNYRADVNNDRIINMKDIGIVARYFFSRSLVWTPGLFAIISPVGTVENVTVLPPFSVTLTSTVSGGVSPYSYQWFQNNNGTGFVAIPGVTSFTYTYATTSFPTLQKGDTWTELFYVTVIDSSPVPLTNGIIAYVTLVT